MHTRNFKFDSIMKRSGSKFVKGVCAIGRVESQIDLSLVCVRHLLGSQNSPHTLIHRVFHNQWGHKRVDLLWGVWVSEAGRTAKEELS